MNNYEVSTTERVKDLENFLSEELRELKNEIEESDLIFDSASKSISSFPLPKNASYFREERRRAISKMLNVSDAPQLKNQGEVMAEELEAALKSDITDGGLPLLLHQFFVDRVQSLVQCKHLHLLRWNRFCQNTSMIERLYDEYKQRLGEIDLEYSNAKQRATRLAIAYTAFNNGEKDCMKHVESEDIVIYLRWFVTNLRCVRRPLSYMKILEWIPLIHHDSINPNSETDEKESEKSESTDNGEFGPRSDSAHSACVLTRSCSRPIDQAFTGMLSNELTSSVPIHTLELANFRAHLEALAGEYGIPVKTDLATSAEEMELFGAVNRQFKRLFNLQEECVTFYPYDFVPEGNEHWGIDSPIHSLLKQCNWLPHINILPHQSALQVKQVMQLKQSGAMDELLVSHSRFLEVSDYSDVVNFLKQHASAVQKPPVAKSMQVTTHGRGDLRSVDILTHIYDDPQLQRGTQDHIKSNEMPNGAVHVKRDHSEKDNYNFSDTMQLLGLDESDDTTNSDPSVVQGAYLSFLHLRILKLRDVRRQCLSLLNYFRSVERTITIYDRGLSLEGESSGVEKSDLKPGKGSKGEKSQKSNAQDEQTKSGRAKTRSLGSHHYINNTPLDFKVEESEFMEFRTVENHDDFYQLEEEDSSDDGIDIEKRTRITASVKTGLNMPHVQDQRGYFIVYELAVKDFKTIESDNLLIASHFVNKHKVHHRSSNRGDGDVDLAAYAHREVDRFAVLLDSWMCELNFLHNKRELLDCYLEAYSNTFDPRDRHALAQTITDIIHLRPRHDLSADYFIGVYKLECACLRFKTDLIKQVLNSQIQESRQHASSSRQLHRFGLPFLSLSKQPIAVNLPKPSLLHLNMFEFHPALGVTASRMTETLRLVLQDLIQAHTPKTSTEAIIIEKQMLEIAIHEWEEWSKPGTSFSPQIQKEVFSGHFIEDPELIEGAVESLLEQRPDSETREEMRVRKCNLWKTALNAVVLHHRLRDAAWETEVLSRIYKHIAREIGYGEYHMHLRLSQLEYAAKKPKADPHPSSFTRYFPDESAADRFLPNHLGLAIQELDEAHLPMFSFYNKASFSAILTNESTLQNVVVALASQVAHRNSLIVAVLQAVTCMQWKEANIVALVEKKETLHAVSDSHGSAHSASSAPSQTSVRSGTGRRNATLSPLNYSSKLTFATQKIKKLSESFISIQFEKTGPRDVMVNEFLKKKESSGILLQKESEVVKLKRQLVVNFCKEYSFRTGIHAMRAQIAACYSGVLSLLDNLPKIRDSYFVLGRPNEKKRRLDDVEGMVPDAKTMHRRPRRVLSSGGTDLLNLWFIPHYTEILSSFRNKDYSTQHNILICWLEIASSLHDILQCLCAHARLGKFLNYAITADWGGTEGVAAALVEIQKQIESLTYGTTAHTRSPVQVAELLKLRKDVMFLEFDASVRQYIRHLFLERDNQSAYDGVTAGMQFALPALSDAPQPSLFQVFLRVPEPLHARGEAAKILFPWLSFEGSRGEFPLMYRTRWRDVESCMQLCLASLNDNERQIANGQILGTSMLYHDILLGGAQQLRSLQEPMEAPQNGYIAANPLGNVNHPSKPDSAADREGAPDTEDDTNEQVTSQFSHLRAGNSKSLSKTKQPITSYKLIKTFFLLCKQVEVLKEYWLQNKMSVEKIDTPNLRCEAERIYFSDIYFPVLQSIARDMGLTECYTDVVSWENTIRPPPNAPEIAIRARQLLKLLESTECLMIQDVRHRVSREFSLVLAERSREEAALPTDLWKRPSITETFTVNRPTIVEDFLHGLMNDYDEEEGKITFTTQHLNKCVFNLSAAVMKREKQNYEMYSTFYENILHHHHQLLYQKERELKAILNKSSSKTFGSETQAQFQLADYSQQLILEITALRSALTELKDENRRKDEVVRQEVQAEHQELVRKLFEECFQMKDKLSRYHLSLHGSIHSLVSETRRESMEMLENLRNRNLNSAASERLKILQVKDEQVKKAEQENTDLNIMLQKLLAFNHWRRSSSATQSKANFQGLTTELSKCKKELQMLHLVSSQNETLLEEQLHCARKALDSSELRLSKVYDRLERQQMARKEKEYRDAKEEKNRRELAEAQKKNLDQIVTELKEKDKRLMVVSLGSARMAKANETANTKVRRKVKNIQSQLEADRILKLEAFNRVDDLQAHVWDYEQAGQHGGAGSISLSRPTSAAMSHAKSSLGIHGYQHDAHSTVISVNTPPYTPRFKARPLSSIPAYFATASEDPPATQKRPRTSSSLKMRSDASGSHTVGRMALDQIFAKQK